MVGIELQMINPTLFFLYLKGCCHGNQFSGKNGAKLPTPCTYRSAIPKRNGISQPPSTQPLAFIALMLENELQCHGLAKRSKRTNDASISWKFREIRSGNFWVDSTHLWMSGTTWPKNWHISSNISWYTGPIFAIFSPYESAYVQMMDLYLIFQLSRDVAMATE